jgi:hypothetical protein
MEALYPTLPGESAAAWTKRVLSHSREHGVNRQCSIGWHEECSDPHGDSCRCPCHHPKADIYSVEGHAEGGAIVVTRVKRGKQRWPAQPGEPATMWAVWILGKSKDDAGERAVLREQALSSPAS